MSVLSIFRSDSETEDDSEPVILSFVVEAKRLRQQAQWRLAQRARLMRRSMQCPVCDRHQILPMGDVEIDETNDTESWFFACESCGSDSASGILG